MATEKKRFMISMTDAQVSLLERLCKETGFTKSAVIVLALEEWAEIRRRKAALDGKPE